MSKRHVTLSDNDEKLVDKLVEGGTFVDAQGVIDEGLRLVSEKHLALRTAIQAGIADLDRGDFKEFADADVLNGYLDELAREVLARDR